MNWLNFVSHVPDDVQKKLAAILPDYLQTLVISVNENYNGLCSVFRLPLYSKEKALEWKKNFEEKSLTTYNVNKTFEENTQKVLFKKCYHCHHNTRATPKVKAHKKHTGCNAKLSITVKQPYMRRSKDTYLREYPTEVDLSFTHNHKLDSADVLRYRHPTPELENTILNYYTSGHSPSSALDSYKTDLFINYGSEYFKIITDGSKCPTRKWCYDLYYKVFKKHYSEPSAEEMTAALERAVEAFNKAENQTCAALGGNKNSVMVAICTPLMKRVYGLESSQEIMFVDSTSNVGKNNKRTVLVFMSPSVAGALPLGIVVTSSDEELAITEGIGLLKEISGVGHFGPKMIMTGDGAAIRNSLRRAYPLSNLLLSRYHVLQSVRRYLFDRTNKIEDSDRHQLYRLFHKTLNEETKEDFERNFEEMLSSTVARKYRNYVQYLTDLHRRSLQWATYARAELVRDNHTYSFSEATIRVLKDRILKCTKAFSVLQLFDFIVKNFSSYCERIIIDTINNRTEDVIKAKYFTADEEIQNLDCYQINDSYYGVVCGNDTFFVDFVLETCTCPVGREGSSCKHQYAVVKKFNLISDSFVSLIDNVTKKSLYFIATGTQYVSDGDFEMFPSKQVDETLEDDLTTVFESLKDKFLKDSDTFQEPIRAFIDNFNNLTDDSALVSALQSFGGDEAGMCPRRRSKRTARGRTVDDRPTPSPRGTPPGPDRELPRRRLERCGNRRCSAAVPSAPDAKKQKSADTDTVEPCDTDKDGVTSKQDEFFMFDPDSKLQKLVVDESDESIRCEQNEDSRNQTPGEQVKLESPQRVECSQMKQAAYEILQDEGSQHEGERHVADVEKEQHVLGECRQAWGEGPGVGLVAAAERQATECGGEPAVPGSGGAVLLEQLQREVDDGRRAASSQLLAHLERNIEATGIGVEVVHDNMAQQLRGLSQDDLNIRKNTIDFTKTIENIPKYFLNVNAAIRDLENNCTQESRICKIMGRESINYPRRVISDFVQEQRQVRSSVQSVNRGIIADDTEYLAGATRDMVPEGVDTGLWNLMDSVGTPAVEGSTIASVVPKTSGSVAEGQAERSSGVRNIVHVPSIVTADRSYSFGGGVMHPDSRGMRYDAELYRQSLWGSGVSLAGHVVPACQGSVGKRGPVRDLASQSMWWSTDGVKAEKWSKGTQVSKQGQALQD